jgi:predicted nucleic acid-binding protein
MAALAEPVVPDATVLSNFASSDAVAWLAGTVPGLAVVPAVRAELAAGRDHGHAFLDRALDSLGDAIPVVPDEDIGEGGEPAVRDRLDAGEAESLRVAIDRGGTLATDDLAAWRLAAEHDVPVTGSIGLLVLGIQRGELDTTTADEWLATWREERGYYAPVESVEAALPDEE